MPLPIKFLVTPMQRRRLERQRRTDQDGSPIGRLNFPATAAGVVVQYAVRSQWPELQKYAPLDWLQVSNNDVVDLDVTINGQGGESFYVPAGTIVPILRPFEHIRIENLDSAVATTLGKVRIRVQRRALDADAVAAAEAT